MDALEGGLELLVQLGVGIDWLLDLLFLFLALILRLLFIADYVLILVMNSEEVLELSASTDFEVVEHAFEVVRDLHDLGVRGEHLLGLGVEVELTGLRGAVALTL